MAKVGSTLASRMALLRRSANLSRRVSSEREDPERIGGSRKAEKSSPSAISGDFSRETFERHVALLGGDSVHPRHPGERADVARRLQRDYGNQYVQRLLSHVQQQTGRQLQRKGKEGLEAEGSEVSGQPNVQQTPEQQESGEKTVSLPPGEWQAVDDNEHGPCDCSRCSARDASRATATTRHATPLIQRNGSKKTPKAPPTEYKISIGRITTEFTNPGTKTVNPFGSEDFNCAHKNAKAKIKGDTAKIDFTIALHCPWGVNGGSNTDVPSATSPVVTTAIHPSGKKVYEQIAEDLTPAKSDNWRPPRRYFWSRALTERHERYHSTMDLAWGKGAGQKVVTDFLKGETISAADTDADLDDLLDQAMIKMSQANFQWYSGGGKPYIERPGEKAAFLEGKNAYLSLARAVRKQGKKLEAAEKKAAKAAEKKAAKATPNAGAATDETP